MYEPQDAYDYDTMRLCGILPPIEEELEYQPSIEDLIATLEAAS